MALVGIVGLATACSSPHPGDGPPTTRAAPTTTAEPTTTTAPQPTTTTLSAPERAVLDGWRAAEEAFYAASYTSNAASPALAATMVNPALQQARALLYAERHDGYIGRGSYNLGHPKVVSITGKEAIVRSCIFDGVIEVKASTGKPAPPPFGVAEKAQERATLIQASAHVWKERQLSVKEGSCSGS